jgi:hypothetical protein
VAWAEWICSSAVAAQAVDEPRKRWTIRASPVSMIGGAFSFMRTQSGGCRKIQPLPSGSANHRHLAQQIEPEDVPVELL